MPTKVYWIHTFDSQARIGIMARPRGNDWLEDEIHALKNKNIDILVSLLEASEVTELELNEEGRYCKALGVEYVNYPIADRSVPQKSVQQLVNYLTEQVKLGRVVVVHCRMGIGRSSIIAAAVLMQFGFSVAELITNISAARGVSVPDTREQVEWLNALAVK